MTKPSQSLALTFMGSACFKGLFILKVASFSFIQLYPWQNINSIDNIPDNVVVIFTTNPSTAFSKQISNNLFYQQDATKLLLNQFSTKDTAYDLGVNRERFK